MANEGHLRFWRVAKASESPSLHHLTEKCQKDPHLYLFLCVYVSVVPLYLYAHTHSTLPWDKRGYTVNHCWCDDGQQTEGTMHKATICRGWDRLAPLSLSNTHRKKAHTAFFKSHTENPVILTYMNLSFDLQNTVAVACCVSMCDSKKWWAEGTGRQVWYWRERTVWEERIQSFSVNPTQEYTWKQRT